MDDIFHHIHVCLTIGGVDYPFGKAVGIPDNVRPVIDNLFCVNNETNDAFEQVDGRNALSGLVDVVVEGFDLWEKLVRENNGEARYERSGIPLGIATAQIVLKEAATGQTVLRQAGRLAASTYVSEDWDKMFEAASEVYLDQVEQDGETFLAQGDYEGRRNFLVITDTLDGQPADGSIDTTKLPNGDYTLTVVVKDEAGNKSQKTMKVQIANQ